MSALQPRDRLIAALDVPSVDEAVGFCRDLQGHVGLVKVGLELFVAEGGRAVRAAQECGLSVFLDLKLHDIPNTVEGAARSAGKLGAKMLTIHSSGGRAMITAARKGLSASGPSDTILLAVTVLTSMSAGDLADQSIPGPVEEHVLRLGRMAIESGADGLVCSPLEVASLRAALPKAILVVPGIRPAGSARGDQARAATPADAIKAGADYLVVGRPLREGGDPKAAADRIVAEIATAR